MGVSAQYETARSNVYYAFGNIDALLVIPHEMSPADPSELSAGVIDRAKRKPAHQAAKPPINRLLGAQED